MDLNADTGLLKAYLNDGEDKSSEYGWKFKPIGTIASGLGAGNRVRIADIDGDGVRLRAQPQNISSKLMRFTA